MRILAIITTVLGLLISSNTGTAGNSRSELERAIANLVGRSGPPSAYVEEKSILLPPGLLQQSLWQRVRSRFEFADLDHPDIDTQIEHFRSGLFSLRSNLTRAEPFLYLIVDELDRAGLPLDLALLPLVESAYNPNAKSERNAVGIWQFIPSTAEIFGLAVNENYDGRKDVVASTRAAVEYLKKLNKTFDGDWLLAMAAYNTGPGNVRSAIAKARAAGIDPNFWNLKLPSETRNYVPRILAAIRIINSPGSYGLELPEIQNRKAVDTIAAGRPFAFSEIANIVGSSVGELARLNPGHLEMKIPQGGPYQITVPTRNSLKLVNAITRDKLGPVQRPAPLGNFTNRPVHDLKYRVVPDAYLPSTPLMASYKPYKKYVYRSHLVERGESLWGVSRAMNTDIDTLLDWSGRSEKPIQPGDELIVAYIGQETDTDVNRQLLSYRVRAMDTLVSISDKFDITISELKKWNPSLWKKNHLQAGQSIRIPVTTSSDL